MSLYYDDLYIGYWDIEKIKELLKRKFYWLDINVDVEDYVRIYFIYQRKAISIYKFYGKLVSLLTLLRL